MKEQKSTVGNLFLRKRLWLGLSISLFGLCLVNKGFYVAGSDPYFFSSGFIELIMGWMAMVLGVTAGIPWLANPFLILAWIVYDKRNSAGPLVCSFFALSLMLSFLLFYIMGGYSGTLEITGYGPGYWLWVCSALTILIPSIFHCLSNRAQNNASQDSTANTQT